MNISPLNQGLFALHRGLQGMQKSADAVVSSKGEYAQMVEAMVSLKTQAHNVEAATKVVKTSDNMLGSVLDVLA